MIAKFVKVRVVEKQLRQHVIRAGVNFFFQVPPVNQLAFLAGDVAFGKAGGSDAEAVLLADELHQLAGKFKTAGRHFELAAARRIAAQREDVFDAERADLREQFADLFARVIHAGQMRDGGEAMLFLDAIHDQQRLVARGAARAVGDGAEIRFQFHQRRDGFLEQGFVALVGLGREKFKRDDRPAGGAFGGVEVSN